ncbi:MAG: DUF411 domain-containing protein [Gemmatimonadota bacterium]
MRGILKWALGGAVVVVGLLAVRSANSPPGALSAQSALYPAGEGPEILVYKTPTCGCCGNWVEHMEKAGFRVTVRDTRDIMSAKREARVPTSLLSCHTALVDGYVVEGHVPADVVKRMLDERPEGAGIAVPGMPVGSPGMEGGRRQPYQVIKFARNGATEVYAQR